MDNNLKKYSLFGFFIFPFLEELLFKVLSIILIERTTEFSKEDRHIRRLEKVKQIENQEFGL